MGGWSLRTRLTAMVVLLIVLTTAVLWMLLPSRLGDVARASFSQQARITGDVVGRSASRTLAEKRPVVPVLDGLRDHPDVRWVRLIGPDFEPIAEVGSPPRIGLQPDDAVFLDDIAVVQNDVSLPNGTLGTLQVAWSVAPLEAGAAEHQRIAIAVSVLWLVFGVVFAQIVGLVLIAPIRRVADAARRVADGDTSLEAMGFTASPDWRTSADETERLRASVQDMANELGQRFEMAQFALESAAEAEQAATDASQMKSSFLANMSHELRTPLNAIIGYTELIAEECDDIEGGDALKGDLERIESSSRHLLGLINDILDLAKVEAGKIELLVEEVSIPAVIAEAIQTATPLVKPGVELSAVLAPEVGVFHTDVTRLKQIVFNLLSNAAKFTKEGHIVVRVTQWDTALVIEVEDTGIGMDAEQQQRLFEAFVQADASTTRDYGGTGLGMALVREFTKMIGGTVEVDSEPGRGTTFRITLKNG